MRKLGLIVNLSNPRAAEALRRVVICAERLELELFADAETCALSGGSYIGQIDKVEELADLAELVVVLGGDGTLLQAASALSGTKLPLMGFNIGSLGYLTCVDEDHFCEALAALKEGEVRISERITLRARIERSDGTVETVEELALNDVVVARGVSARLIHIGLVINGRELTTYVCDGVIVATPTGSTAYSLSAGGPIVLPETAALTIGVICPHTLAARPLVVPLESKLELDCLKSSDTILLSLDGRESLYLEPGDKVVVERSDVYARIAFLSTLNPFEVLNRKLGWGGSLRGRISDGS